MKKRFISILLLSFALCIEGCGKDEPEAVIVPDIIIEESVSEDVIAEEPVIEETIPDESITAEEHKNFTDEEVEEKEPAYPYWWELHDFNSDQEILLQDGEFKNLTLQPGNKPDELYVTWFSKSSSRGKVTFEKGGLFDSITAKATTQGSISVPGYYRNSALITGLESNTTYSYHLSNGKNQSPTYTYETGDLYSTDFTFMIAGDPELGLGDPEVLPGHRSIWKVVLNRMRTQIPDSSFIITTGDQIAKPDSTEQYDYFLDNSVLYSTPLVPVVGNHDSGTGFFGDHFSLPNMSSIGHEAGNDGDYWFTKGNVLFMILNNMCPQPTEVHEQFVAEAIEANPEAKWRIIISHYSPVTSVERYLSTRESVMREYEYMGEVFDIDLFIGGHDHAYTRGYFIDDDGDPINHEDYPIEDDANDIVSEFYNPKKPLYIIVNGATDALLREPEGYPWAAVSVQNGVPQLSEVHVTEDSLTITTHDADSWATVDDFTIYKD